MDRKIKENELILTEYLLCVTTNIVHHSIMSFLLEIFWDNIY